MSIVNRLSSAWNAFMNRDPPWARQYDGASYSTNPDKTVLTGGNEKTILTSIINRIALDCAEIGFKHVQVDEFGNYVKEVDSDLDNCLTLSANVDQTSNAFIQDAVIKCLDTGSVALVPTLSDRDLTEEGEFVYKIYTLRTGEVYEWHPKYIKAHVYDGDADKASGRKQDICLLKDRTGIIQNPFYAVMNDRNSTFQRLRQKLALLDQMDQKRSSGKLDLIIQLPYTLKTDYKKNEAESRRQQIIEQLTKSEYGIAYTDATEKITQLSRPVENNLLDQIKYLTEQVQAQLNIDESVLNGTASEGTLLSYYTRTVEPIMNAFAKEMTRKFLTETARNRNRHKIAFYRERWKLIPINQLNTVFGYLQPSEIRELLGFRPDSGQNGMMQEQTMADNIGDIIPQNQPTDGSEVIPQDQQEISPLDIPISVLNNSTGG